MIKQMGMVYTIILMVLVMRAIGERTSSMATGKRVGLMAQFMKVYTLQVRSMA